ncbi:GNAT family N-acetyltransferase [Planosporangium thailandense]|uniref:GNAT family N-acetyltransferase n=1 Tax=Planosporangium thailandense TaxID=765197 RepID=A0ABX0Y3C1_9ACTN|nr:GNAT family N-acetyltransferase [Planosporangium thailandense]NJC72885.1 GNAT family N-acetyltransferase [Planosporangium thailandense]
MVELTAREYREADASRLAELINLVEEDAGGHAGLTAGYVESTVRGLVRDPVTDTRLLSAPDGDLVAVGLVFAPPGAGSRVDLMGCVHPRWRGRGIGRDLLGWELDRAAEVHRAAGAGTAWEAQVDTAAGNDSADRLYRRFGFSPVRYWFHMVAPTGSASHPTLPDGIRVTGYQAGHDKELHEAHTEAFADHWGSQARQYDDWATMTVRSESFLPGLSTVAFDGDEIAGYALTYGDADPGRIYIGQVGVRRPWRRRGLAGALLTRVLAAARAEGRQTASLGVDADSPTGAVGVYERAGFEVVSRAVTYARPLLP